VRKKVQDMIDRLQWTSDFVIPALKLSSTFLGEEKDTDKRPLVPIDLIPPEEI
jgi:hypothetical protein